jgi:hypothetical protein
MVMLYTLWGNPLSAGEDDVVYYYPLRVMVAEHLKAGELPLYNPREATGMPLMADPQTAVMYPATWLFVVLPPKLAYSLSIFAAFSLAGGGAYLYLRRLGLVRAGAMFGAIAFMFCGFMVGHRVHLSMIQAAAMLPWGLWCIEGLRRDFGFRISDFGFQEDHAVRESSIRNSQSAMGVRKTLLTWLDHRVAQSALWLVPVVFLTIAAGHWPTLIHLAMVWTVYGLIRVRPLLSGLALGAAAVALAAIMAWPQIHITSQLMAEVTRNKIGYATAGENSFFPTSAVLELMPFFMGTRNPNFFSQPWWGSWHLCEMLGYVGLVTLALALGAMWRLYRKGTRHWALGTREERSVCLVPGAQCLVPSSSLVPSAQCLVPSSSLVPSAYCLVPAVRCWTWIIIGSGIFMLGYYLPTYKLVTMLPVMGVVRCPARMVLAVDLGLAVLAAVAIHCVLVAPTDDRVRRLRRTVIVLAVIVLPLTMFVMVRFWSIAGNLLLTDYPDKFPFLPFDGGAKAAIQAASITNPAVYVPAIMMFLTAVVLVLWLRRCGTGILPVSECTTGILPVSGGEQQNQQEQQQQDRAKMALEHTGRMPVPHMLPQVVLVLLLLADLFWITRFVDVPSGRIGPNVETSPAAQWLKKHDPDTSSYRVWGLSKSYHDRPDELLLPKTCEAMGFLTIANYGPFQSPAQVQLFGFRPWGECNDWETLVRRNHLLSLYGVKYVLVTMEDDDLIYDMPRFTLDITTAFSGDYIPRRPDGENLLSDQWTTEQRSFSPKIQGSGRDQIITLRTPLMFRPSQAWQEVGLRKLPDVHYRISLDARGPENGAAGFLRAETFPEGSHLGGFTIEADQIGPRWRHFEWVEDLSSKVTFRLFTLSERPIEVRNVSVRRAQEIPPIDKGEFDRGTIAVNVYRKLVELPAVNKGDPPVAIYQNMFCNPIKPAPGGPGANGPVPTNEQLESVKYPPSGAKLESLPVPDISLRPVDNPARLIWCLTLPAMALYVLIVIVAVTRRRS